MRCVVCCRCCSLSVSGCWLVCVACWRLVLAVVGRCRVFVVDCCVVCFVLYVVGCCCLMSFRCGVSCSLVVACCLWFVV